MTIGTLVISLDFELHWGVRDHVRPHDPYRRNLLGARSAVIRLLDLFAEYEIAATWATVGYLFARDREELRSFSPAVRPAYRDERLDPYRESIGAGEEEDPLHFAPSLVQAVLDTPRQELATHTYSHYYCLEPGQSPEAFAADLASAVAIARRRGIELVSIVFPRNQHNPAYDAILAQHGIRCFRGNQQAWMYDPRKRGRAATLLVRAGRLVDGVLPLAGMHTYPFSRLVGTGPVNVPASYFVRPLGERPSALGALGQRRLRSAVRHAARRGEIVHLWWHPHNFGVATDRNIDGLRSILEVYRACRAEYGMRSVSMAQLAYEATEAAFRHTHGMPIADVGRTVADTALEGVAGRE